MRLPRRDFIERALAGAVVAFAHGRATAEPAAATPPDGRAADATVRVAVIGVNGQGSAHVGELLEIPGAELVAICDCDPGAAERCLARHFGQDGDRKPPEYVQDVRRLLDRADVDAVTIATPNHSHAILAVWAMQTGKDVYVEKPCSHNVREGRVMVEWARKLGRICQVGIQGRSMAGMRETLDFVRGGKVGPVRVAHAVCYRRRGSIGRIDTPAPLPPGIDFDLWAGPAPHVVPVRERLHYDWHWTRVTGNGDLGNQNPHELDRARWGLGKRELPQRVVSLGGRLGYVDNGDVANSQVTIFRWDDALLISDVRGLEIRTPVDFGLASGSLRAATIWWGTEGYVVSPNYSCGAAFDYDGNELGKWSGGEYRAHFANFLDAVRSRRPEDLHLDIEEGHLSSALAHLGNVSWALGEPVSPGTRARLAGAEPHVRATWESFEAHLEEHEIDYDVTRLVLGRELTIDPATERATDDAANARFTREYRKGFELPVA